MDSIFLYSGELISDEGLQRVATALKHCSWRIELVRSGYDQTLYLRTPFGQKEINLEMDSGQSGRFLFQGDVEASLGRAMKLLEDLTRCLQRAGIVHRIELYDETKNLVGYTHHHWPSSKSD